MEIGEIFILVLAFIIVVFLCYDSNRGTNIIPYWINGPSDFRQEVVDILKKSGWNKKYKIFECNKPEEALITINLTKRKDMDKWHRKPEYYVNIGTKSTRTSSLDDKYNLSKNDSSKKQIRFSVTVQDVNDKPQIYIDEENWYYGVIESKLTPLEYKTYVINHEFGHGLGYDHQKCPAGNSKVCPVMYQMTRGIPEGGLPNYNVLDQDYTERIKGRYRGIV